MSPRSFLHRLPRPVSFALYGAAAGLLAALTVGELVWYAPAPPPLPEAHTAPPASPPAPQLAVIASPAVSVYPGGTNTVAVRVARDRFDGPVTVAFAAPGIGAEVIIPAGETSGRAVVAAAATAKPGAYTLTATATATAAGRALSASATVEVTVVAPPAPPAGPRLAVTAVAVPSAPKVPVDVVFALDCTGSMEKAVAGIDAALPKFAAALAKADLDVRFGLVGFQDTTLGQRLKVPRIDGERMTASAARLGAAMTALRLGGGGGEGESSLDGVAEAADGPFREPAVRVVLLVTDGGPKKADGRMKNMDEAVKYLRAKRIDQLHVVALPEHRKAFEPLWDGAKGAFFDLGAANASGDYDTLMADLAKAVCDALPARPANRPEPSAAAPQPALPPALPPAGSVKPPALPPGAEPDEPKVETRAAAPVAEVPVNPPQPSERGRVLVRVVWSVTVAACVCLALLTGQMTVLPGGRPSLGLAASTYGVALIVGGAVGGALAGAFVARAISGCLFGLVFGLMVPLSEKWFRAKPTAEPLSFDVEPVPAVVAPPVIEPAIAAPKPRDGCPGCGRTIPGGAGKRYCMVCDYTF